jgi:exopolyphosphatase/guanosine-5'-triphosphate,3'-diphosphate pyrophosphatase
MPAAAGGVVASVIDVGSNSVLLLTVEVTEGRARQIDAALATTQLGTGLAPGRTLDRVAAARTGEAVVAFARRARARGAQHVWAFATGAVRAAADGPAFAQALATRAGCDVAILSGRDEARFAWEAVATGVGAGAAQLLAVDVGGATTELTRGAGTTVHAAVSLPIGALVLTERHVGDDPPSPGDGARVERAIDAVLADAAPLRIDDGVPRVVASGGTASALAALDLGLATYDPARVHGHTIAAPRLAALRAEMQALPAAERARQSGLDPGRARILPAGAAILARVVERVGTDALVVSDHGVRHALLRSRLADAGVACDLGSLWS